MKSEKQAMRYQEGFVGSGGKSAFYSKSDEGATGAY